MLRVYFLQLWFNLSDPAVEEALYDSAAMRSFAGVDLGQEGAPDETTVCAERRPASGEIRPTRPWRPAKLLHPGALENPPPLN